MSSPFLEGGVFDAYWKAGHGANSAAAGEPAETAPRPDPARDHNGGEVTMSEQAPERSPADEYAAFEEEAAALLEEGGDDLDSRASVLIRRFRKLAKQHSRALEQVREQTLAEVAEQRRTEAAWRRAGVPPELRPLFPDVDPADEQAVQAKIAELRSEGVRWHGMPEPPAPPSPPTPDPALLAMRAMVEAEAGGRVEGNPDLQGRLERMAQNPGAFSDAQLDAAVEELNGQVRAAGTSFSSGSVG